MSGRGGFRLVERVRKGRIWEARSEELVDDLIERYRDLIVGQQALNYWLLDRCLDKDESVQELCRLRLNEPTRTPYSNWNFCVGIE